MIDPERFAPTEPAAESSAYVYNPDLLRAIKVALAVGRPLLLRGAPGCGKTTLARDVARVLAADYYQEVVTSRTQARDLEWRFDALLRLAETQLPAQRDRVANAANYVEPKALWWAFNPVSASSAGGAAEPAKDPLAAAGGSSKDRCAVVLVDEIDKADPEVANDLLEPFDVRAFTVAETGTRVTPVRDVFLVVTTNEERDLPSAFLRRCVVHELERPDADVLAKIAASHLGAKVTAAVVAAMVERLDELTAEADKQNVRAPGTAEFLDALKACDTLQAPAGDEWNAVTRLTMWKHRPAAKRRSGQQRT